MPCAGNVPVIVASGHINNPSGGAINPFTIFTPTAEGVFRVSAYVTNAGAMDAYPLELTWTDENGSQSIEASPVEYVLTTTFHSLADAIQLQTTSYNLSDTDLYYIVEQLA